jgi:hypothetical protein
MWWWPTASLLRKAASTPPLRGKEESTHRGLRAGHACTGVPQEPGSSSRLLRPSSGRSTGDHGPRPKAGGMQLPVERNQHPRAGPERRGKAEDDRDGERDVGGSHRTREAGEVTPGDPVEERGSRDHRLIGGKDGGNTESQHHLHITSTHSDTGQGSPATGAHHAGAPYRRALPAGSVPPNAERCRRRDRRPNGAALCGRPRDESRVPPAPVQVGYLLRSPSSTRLHPEG